MNTKINTLFITFFIIFFCLYYTNKYHTDISNKDIINKDATINYTKGFTYIYFDSSFSNCDKYVILNRLNRINFYYIETDNLKKARIRLTSSTYQTYSYSKTDLKHILKNTNLFTAGINLSYKDSYKDSYIDTSLNFIIKHHKL